MGATPGPSRAAPTARVGPALRSVPYVVGAPLEARTCVVGEVRASSGTPEGFDHGRDPTDVPLGKWPRRRRAPRATTPRATTPRATTPRATPLPETGRPRIYSAPSHGWVRRGPLGRQTVWGSSSSTTRGSPRSTHTNGSPVSRVSAAPCDNLTSPPRELTCTTIWAASPASPMSRSPNLMFDACTRTFITEPNLQSLDPHRRRMP
jgi:hypothetical protein